MTGEALAGWVLGVLDASDGAPPTDAQIRTIRARLSAVLNVPEMDVKSPGEPANKKAAKASKVTRQMVLDAAKGPKTGLPPEVPDDMPNVERMG